MKHGEERNRRQETSEHGETEFLDATTGEVVYRGSAVSHTRSVVERWCSGCQEWVKVDGIMGFFRFMAEHDPHRRPDVEA
jgi:phage host-nuclease inhibitor protein Gam